MMEHPPPEADAHHDTVNLFLKVDRSQLVFLNGLIESYDDLAVIRTLDPAEGIVVVMAAPGHEETVRRLLDSLAGELALEYVEPAGNTLEGYRRQIYGLA